MRSITPKEVKLLHQFKLNETRESEKHCALKHLMAIDDDTAVHKKNTSYKSNGFINEQHQQVNHIKYGAHLDDSSN